MTRMSRSRVARVASLALILCSVACTEQADTPSAPRDDFTHGLEQPPAARACYDAVLARIVEGLGAGVVVPDESWIGSVRLGPLACEMLGADVHVDQATLSVVCPRLVELCGVRGTYEVPVSHRPDDARPVHSTDEPGPGRPTRHSYLSQEHLAAGYPGAEAVVTFTPVALDDAEVTALLVATVTSVTKSGHASAYLLRHTGQAWHIDHTAELHSFPPKSPR